MDYTSINMNAYYGSDSLFKTKALLYQIYKNIRSLIRGNSLCRNVLNLETEERGVYTLDVAFELVNKMLQYSQFTEFTYKKCYIIAKHLNQIEVILRDILQFFKYFYRTSSQQKPDIFSATEEYKEMADKLTMDELKEIVGKNHKIDFNRLESGIVNRKSLEAIDGYEEKEEAINTAYTESESESESETEDGIN